MRCKVTVSSGMLRYLSMMGVAFSIDGTRFRNCGAPPEQQQLAQAQTSFYNNLVSVFREQFASQNSVLDAIRGQFEPILAAGPGQKGFSAEEEAALRTQASDSTARGAQQAMVALGAKEATMGDAGIPSGAKLQLEGGLLGSAAQEEAGLQEHITESDYAVGRENFLNAATALGGVAHENNPLGYAGVATGAGESANKTQNDIAAENSAWMGPVFGLLGGLGSAALMRPH